MAEDACPGADSNRDAFRHYPLKIACLPVSPPGRGANLSERSEQTQPDPPPAQPALFHVAEVGAAADGVAIERDVDAVGSLGNREVACRIGAVAVVMHGRGRAVGSSHKDGDAAGKTSNLDIVAEGITGLDLDVSEPEPVASGDIRVCGAWRGYPGDRRLCRPCRAVGPAQPMRGLSWFRRRWRRGCRWSARSQSVT